MDIFNFKLECIGLRQREDLIVDALQNSSVDELGALEKQFEFQSEQSKNRIFFKFLFAQNTDNTTIKKIMEALQNNTEIPGKMSESKKAFFNQYKRILIGNEAFKKFWQKFDTKEALKPLRALYVDRIFAASKVESVVHDRLIELAAQITLPEQTRQIPQINFLPLLQIGTKQWDVVRKVFQQMEANKQ